MLRALPVFLRFFLSKCALPSYCVSVPNLLGTNKRTNAALDIELCGSESSLTAGERRIRAPAVLRRLSLAGGHDQKFKQNAKYRNLSLSATPWHRRKKHAREAVEMDE